MERRNYYDFRFLFSSSSKSEWKKQTQSRHSFSSNVNCEYVAGVELNVEECEKKKN